MKQEMKHALQMLFSPHEDNRKLALLCCESQGYGKELAAVLDMVAKFGNYGNRKFKKPLHWLQEMSSKSLLFYGTEIPAEIVLLNDTLKDLHVSNPQLKQLTKEILQLTNLETLRVSSDKLTDATFVVETAKELKVDNLTITCCYALQQLPEAIKDIELETLIVSACRVTEIKALNNVEFAFLCSLSRLKAVPEMPNAKALNLLGTNNFSAKELYSITDKCPKLEVLKLDRHCLRRFNDKRQQRLLDHFENNQITLL